MNKQAREIGLLDYEKMLNTLNEEEVEYEFGNKIALFESDYYKGGIKKTTKELIEELMERMEALTQ